MLTSTRLGYRGAFLLILAAVDLLYGFALVRPADEQLVTSAYLWRDRIMPPAFWGIIWMAAGLILAVNAFQRQDRIGYGTAISVKVGWAFVAFASWVSGNVHQGWITGVTWLCVALLATVASSWPEPLHVHEVTVIDDTPEAD